MAFEQMHGTALCCQNKGIAAEACGGIDHVLVLLGIDCFGNQFTTAFLAAIIQAA